MAHTFECLPDYERDNSAWIVEGPNDGHDFVGNKKFDADLTCDALHHVGSEKSVDK